MSSSSYLAARNFILGTAFGLVVAVTFVDQLLDAVYVVSFAVKDLLTSVRAASPAYSPPPLSVSLPPSSSPSSWLP